MESHVHLEWEEGIAWITVARPQALNALDAQVLEDFTRVLDRVEADQARCAVVQGAGNRAFVAGADIAQMVELDPTAAQSFARRGQAAFERLEALSFPVIAAVNGFALGGGLELALACDLIVAAANAELGQPEINLGILPGFGGTQRLIRRVGPGMARWLIFTGKRIAADEALRIGLVDQVVPADKLTDTVRALALELAAKPSFALRQAKALLRLASETPLAQGLEAEANAFALCFAHPDRSEGMRAFLEKRRARFS